MADYKLGENLKRFRKDNGFSQKEICIELNITQQAYSHYECDERTPDLDTLRRLAGFYHITLDQLVDTDGSFDPLAALPAEYQEMIRSYDELPLDKQKQVRDYIMFLKQQP